MRLHLSRKMKTPARDGTEKLDESNLLNLRGRKKNSLLTNLGRVKKSSTRKTVSEPLDINSICTYHLVQITLEKVEKLLKQLSSPPSRQLKKRLQVGKHTYQKTNGHTKY